MLIGLTGFIGSGKGTAANILTGQYGFKEDSFASTVKDVCSIVFVWPRYLLEGDTAESRIWREQVDYWWAERLAIPDFTPRRALQMIGSDLFRQHFSKDIWLHSLARRMTSGADTVVSDIRYPNELELIRSLGGVVIDIRRAAPEWYDVACSAVAGCKDSLMIMETKYAHVHDSEWSLAGYKSDYVVNNNGSIHQLELRITNIMTTLNR